MPEDTLAPCGFYCSGCPAYKAAHGGSAEDRERLAKKWSRANGKKMTVPEVLCDGCMSGGRLVAFCAACAIRTCAIAKDYPTCAHCPDMETCGKIVPEKTRKGLRELKEKLGI